MEKRKDTKGKGEKERYTHLNAEFQRRARRDKKALSLSDGIPVELFQILKDDTVEVLHSVCQQIWKTQQWPQDWKRSVFILVLKNAQSTAQLHSSHMLIK